MSHSIVLLEVETAIRTSR